MIRFAILVTLASFVLAGCGCGGDPGNGNLKGSDQTSLEALNKAATEYKGDWSKVTPEEKELILKRFDGDEDQAKATIEAIAKGRQESGTKPLKVGKPPPQGEGVGLNDTPAAPPGQPVPGTMGNTPSGSVPTGR